MKRAVTADQIAEWFTLGAQFVNVRITDEPRRDQTHTHGEEEEKR